MDTDENNLHHQNEELCSETRIKTEASGTAKSELEAITSANQINDITDERDRLLIISSRKDRTIDRLRLELKMLEAQLTSAVSAKNDALARLDSIEGKEQSLEYKEKRMEREKDLLNIQIAHLTDSLNNTTSELLAVRQESSTAALQLENELKCKNDELRIKNASICQLTDANQFLKNRNEENVAELNEQANKSVDLLNNYRKEVDAESQLVELYKRNSNDDQAHINELTEAIKQMKGLLNESVAECEAFKTKLRGIEENHQTELNSETEVIEKLKRELHIANELLKTNEGKNTKTDVCPSSVDDNCRLNSGLTLTEICSSFYSVQEELRSKEREYNQLKVDIEAIIAESQIKAPEFENLRVKYKAIVTVNEELTQKIDNYIVEKVLIQEEFLHTRSKFQNLEKENAELKSGQNDLSKQVCNLLNKIGASTVGMTSDQNQLISSDMPANEVISKTLVTFNNIEELQENNQKLLLLVRDLSTQCEKMEITLKSIDGDSYETKITGLQREIYNLEYLLLKRNMETKRFKRLYHEIMEDFCKESSATTNSLMSEQMERKNDVAVSENAYQISSNSNKDKNFLEMEKTKMLKDVKEEYNEYPNEKSEELIMLNKQINALRNQVRELTETNLNMSNEALCANAQIESLKRNITTYKREIETLEKCNQMHEKTIAEHNISSKYLRAEASNNMKKLSAAETRNEHLQRECHRLMDINKSLEIDQSQNREKLSDSNLQSSLEMIKESVERLDNEGSLRMAERLDDTIREASALRLRLQHEQEHFREEINAMNLQKENAENKMSDEQSTSETLRAKLIKAEEQIEAKNQEIIELTRQIPRSIEPSLFDNAIDDHNSKFNEFKQQLENKIVEIENLKRQITVIAGNEVDFIQIASVWEGDAIALQHNFELTKNKLTADLITSQLNEIKLKAQVEEIRLHITDADANAINIQTELKEGEFEDLRSEFNTLKMNLKIVEYNYYNEMQAHSSDLQMLIICKDELNKCQEQMDQLRVAKDVVNQSLETSRIEWKKVAAADRLELEQKLECLNQQSIASYDQLHAHAQHNKLLPTNNDSINDSGNTSILSATLTEEEVNETSCDKLWTIINSLRNEKDISVAKAEVYKSENTRLLNESELQEKRLNELNRQLTEAKNSTDIGSAAKYDDLLRKIETLNVMTASNMHLREERDVLASKVKDLTNRITTLEDELFPIQEMNRELSDKIEEQTHECVTLQIKLEYWMKHASNSVNENDENIESLKRFHNDREKEWAQSKKIDDLSNQHPIQFNTRVDELCSSVLLESTSENLCRRNDANSVEFSISPMFAQNSHSVAVLHTSQTNEIPMVKELSPGGHKRPPDSDTDSSTGVKESSSSEQATQNKRTRLSEQAIQLTESGLVVPTSSQCEIIVVVSDAENERSDESESQSNVNIDEDGDDYIDVESIDEIEVEEDHGRIQRGSMTIEMPRSLPIDLDEGVREQQRSPRAILNQSERIRRRPTIQRSIPMVSAEGVYDQQNSPHAINRSVQSRGQHSLRRQTHS